MTKDKQLKGKAIQIKGKDYVLVSDRILYFNSEYPKGSIKTELLSEISSSDVYIKATVIPSLDEPERCFNGHAQEKWGEGFINKTSAVENAETSAVGRALGMMGIGVIDSIASMDEINKANNRAGAKETGLEVGQKAPLCPQCDSIMIASKKKPVWFCPNWKESGCVPVAFNRVDRAGNIVEDETK